MNYTFTDEDKKPHTFFELEPAETLVNKVGHYVQRQRYTSIEKLRKAKTTDDL